MPSRPHCRLVWWLLSTCGVAALQAETYTVSVTLQNLPYRSDSTVSSPCARSWTSSTIRSLVAPHVIWGYIGQTTTGYPILSPLYKTDGKWIPAVYSETHLNGGLPGRSDLGTTSFVNRASLSASGLLTTTHSSISLYPSPP